MENKETLRQCISPEMNATTTGFDLSSQEELPPVQLLLEQALAPLHQDFEGR
jgi:hypothetical protein